MSRQLHWPTLEEMKEQKERYHDWFYHHPNVVHALKAFGMAFVLRLVLPSSKCCPCLKGIRHGFCSDIGFSWLHIYLRFIQRRNPYLTNY